jgi:hypothetical protein
VRSLVAIAIFALGASLAHADDEITITYINMYSLPGRSAENSTIQIKRDADDYPDVPGAELATFFGDIRKVLDTAHTPAKWEFAPPPHVDIIRVEIALGTRRHLLSTGFISGKPEVPIGANANDRRQLAALKKLLSLTTERMARKFGAVQSK